MSRRSDLRAGVVERSGGGCEWPGCSDRGAELAHLHSIGMGGRASADTLENVAWLCRVHARLSDGERVAGVDFVSEHLLLGVEVEPAYSLAWRRAEALRIHLQSVW